MRNASRVFLTLQTFFTIFITSADDLKKAEIGPGAVNRGDSASKKIFLVKKIKKF
jgi:hypothetical protein